MLLPIIAGAAVAVTAGYNSMAPRSQLYGCTFIGERRPSRRLSLTFDDGPNDPYTLHLLDVLARHNVRATFFMVGSFVEQRPGIARAVAAAGHAIGNHTHTHPNLIFHSGGVVRRELQDCERAFDHAGVVRASLFRPPFGGRTPIVLRTARDLGLEPIMWSVTAHDWEPYSPEKIAQLVHRQVRGGDVILLHDGGHMGMGTDRSASVRATELIIQRYQGEGFEFVTIPEMMQAKQEQKPRIPADQHG